MKERSSRTRFMVWFGSDRRTATGGLQLLNLSPGFDHPSLLNLVFLVFPCFRLFNLLILKDYF